MKLSQISQTTKFLCIILVLALAPMSCSTGQTEEEAANSENSEEKAQSDAATADAGTDAVPQANAEGAPASSLDSSPAPTPSESPLLGGAGSSDLSNLGGPLGTPSPTPSPDLSGSLSTPSGGAGGSPSGAELSSPSSVASPEKSEPSTGSGDGRYTVKAGDTLMKIAFEVYGDLYKWREIYEMNKDQIKNPNNIPAEVVIKYNAPASPVTIQKNGEKYLIKKGDTLGTISQSVYGDKTRWKEIYENNRQLIKNPDKIFAGFYLYYTSK